MGAKARFLMAGKKFIDCCTDKGLYLYSGGERFESPPEHHLEQFFLDFMESICRTIPRPATSCLSKCFPINYLQTTHILTLALYSSGNCIAWVEKLKELETN
jgi:hypothetical protein